MNHHLTKDQFAALAEIRALAKGAKHSACVARNGKHLTGIKLLIHRKDGSYVLTEKGSEALFVKDCIAGLTSLVDGSASKLDAAVATFLGRKGHIVASGTSGKFEITEKGRACLEDIAQNP